MYATLHSELEQFGFIVRFTEGKRHITGVRPEPWHLRYVGVENAKTINERGLCLEEYVEQLQTAEKEAQEEAVAKKSFDDNVQQVVVIYPVFNQALAETSKAKKEEEKVQ